MTTDFQLIPLNDIKPDPGQPRKYFDPEKLQEFADHLKVVGVKQPISVRANPDAAHPGEPPFMIIAGERRWTASNIAQLSSIPAIVETVDSDDQDLYTHQLSENFFRENLNPVEEAEYIGNRIEYLRSQGESSPTQKAADELGVSISWISRKTAILKYGSDIRALARKGYVRDYRALRKLEKLSGTKREEAIQLIEQGEFNSKEFFSRRRKPKHTECAEIPKEKPLPQIGLQMTTNGWVKLIEKTDFCSILSHTEPEWRNADPEQLRAYLKTFRDWCAEEH